MDSENLDRINQLKEIHRRAIELKQSRILKKEDLKTIRKLWAEQEKCLAEAEKSGNPSVQEMILDLKIILSTGSYVGHHIRELQASATEFCPRDYADKLLAKFSSDGDQDWMRLSKDAVRIINRAPGIPILLGTYSPNNDEIETTPKERQKKTIVRDLKPVLAKKETAGKVENISEDSDSVDVKVKRILRILKKLYERNGTPISFYRFVLHPQNFTTTVENIFYISFIIRDGLASLDITPDGELVIFPLEEKDEKKENSSNKQQMVFSITMEEYEELAREYDIREPLIH